jgi:hypothetical protein
MKIPLNECANLVRLEDGSVVVLFEKRHYKWDDVVPTAILGENYRLDAPQQTFRALHFVDLCMTGKFGPADQWPTAAEEFVYSNSRSPGAELKAPCAPSARQSGGVIER